MVGAAAQKNPDVSEAAGFTGPFSVGLLADEG
jgi:hypothetical protein